MVSKILGVVGDTHVPDRRRRIHPHIVPILEREKVDAIVHAGDISVPRVLRELEQLAPVIPVRGNRDWFPHPDLPLWRVIELHGQRIGLTHGHGGWLPYLRDKLRYLLRGPRTFDHYMRRAIELLPEDLDAIIFGHNHAPMNRIVEGKLVFSPGSACCHVFKQKTPSMGILRVSESKIRGEIIPLERF